MDKKPNFLVIMSDEHGAQFSSTYGHPIIETPNMDRLAEQGVTFDANYCNSPLCIPSRASFMTTRCTASMSSYRVTHTSRSHSVTSGGRTAFRRQPSRGTEFELPIPASAR